MNIKHTKISKDHIEKMPNVQFNTNVQHNKTTNQLILLDKKTFNINLEFRYKGRL